MRGHIRDERRVPFIDLSPKGSTHLNRSIGASSSNDTGTSEGFPAKLRCLTRAYSNSSTNPGTGQLSSNDPSLSQSSGHLADTSTHLADTSTQTQGDVFVTNLDSILRQHVHHLSSGSRTPRSPQSRSDPLVTLAREAIPAPPAFTPRTPPLALTPPPVFTPRPADAAAAILSPAPSTPAPSTLLAADMPSQPPSDVRSDWRRPSENPFPRGAALPCETTSSSAREGFADKLRRITQDRIQLYLDEEPSASLSEQVSDHFTGFVEAHLERYVRASVDNMRACVGRPHVADRWDAEPSGFSRWRAPRQVEAALDGDAVCAELGCLTRECVHSVQTAPQDHFITGTRATTWPCQQPATGRTALHHSGDALETIADINRICDSIAERMGDPGLGLSGRDQVGFQDATRTWPNGQLLPPGDGAAEAYERRYIDLAGSGSEDIDLASETSWTVSLRDQERSNGCSSSPEWDFGEFLVESPPHAPEYFDFGDFLGDGPPRGEPEPGRASQDGFAARLDCIVRGWVVQAC